MNIKKEIKVGILGIIAILVFYFGFSFLKGLDLFSTVNEYHVTFKDVQGLEKSNPVMYNGVNVGRVMELTPNYEKEEVDVLLSVKKGVLINDQTTATLADNGLIGGKIIKLKIGKGKELSDGATIKGLTETNLMASVQEKLSPSLRNIDSLTTNLTKIVKQFDKTGDAVKLLVANATVTSTGVNALVAGNSKSIGEVTKNAAVLTQNLNELTKSLDKDLKPILAKTGTFTDSLSRMQLNKTVKTLNGTIADIKKMVDEINHGKGTLGKLTGDDSLYVNMDRTAASLNKLLADMKVNPKRYVHFSLFGRKNN